MNPASLGGKLLNTTQCQNQPGVLPHLGSKIIYLHDSLCPQPLPSPSQSLPILAWGVGEGQDLGSSSSQLPCCPLWPLWLQ